MENVLTKKDLNNSWLRWQCFNHSVYNYERMQGLCCCLSMVPIVRKLYPNDAEKRKEALLREMQFFNTEVIWGASILGLAVAMEEQVARGELEDPDSITAVKSGLMGPFAGIGDTVTQGIFTPLTISIGIGLTMGGATVAGPIFLVVVQVAYALILGHISWFLGHDKGADAIMSILESGAINQLIQGAGILGCTVMGALISNYVSVKCGINIQTEYASFNVQTDLLDALLPNLLPLLTTLGCWVLVTKGWSTAKVTLLIFVVGIVGSLLHILA
ncbi:MAG: PTS system mannose/fructose/sorbose family transporter subunit IID [Erysipelotrichaceae bacterium]|nr:PTS system mannose/fructose/sorbose family transporter subunit IID [Erysipelotrichaceae bacterium]